MSRLQISFAALFVCGAVLAVGQPPGKAVIGYIYSPNRPLDPRDVAAEKLTHINYAFANIKDGLMVEGYAGDPENYRTLNNLKERNPKLKILVSVGGWTWSGGFSDMALTPQSRKRFIDSAVVFLELHRLDGLDVDWEYPGQKGLNNTNRPEDKVNCTAFLAEARSALDEAGKAAGKRYLLTMATGTNDSWIEHTEMDKAHASLDFVNLMTYDFREAEGDPLATPGRSDADIADIADRSLLLGTPAGEAESDDFCCLSRHRPQLRGEGQRGILPALLPPFDLLGRVIGKCVTKGREQLGRVAIVPEGGNLDAGWRRCVGRHVVPKICAHV